MISFFQRARLSNIEKTTPLSHHGYDDRRYFVLIFHFANGHYECVQQLVQQWRQKSFDPLIHLDTNHTIKGYFPNDYFCLASKVDGGARHN